MQLCTPTGTPFTALIDAERGCVVITSETGNDHAYSLSALRDLYLWLLNERNGEWVLLGSRGEEEIPPAGSVEEWARSENNPVGGFYGITRGRRGRFSSYVPSILEELGFVEVEHNARNNRVRALPLR